MLPKAESACFVIADISGYTHFVSGVELDHAQDIIADIMDTLVRALRPPFRLAKFEGDAAFVYALTDKVDGALMQDSIEQAYFAFRKRLRSIKQASSCECQACSRMQSLDVKFVVHHGEFIRQKMSGREELAGRDVILVHRLLKNEVGKAFGQHAYALYSDACVQAMGIDPAGQGLLEHTETIEHIGETKCWAGNLEQAWKRETETARNLVQRTGAYIFIERDFAAPKQAVWDLVTSPQHHARWQRADGVVENNAQGRRGAGTQNHCLHGKDAVIEDIVDWRPFDYVTLTAQLPIPGAPKILFSYSFEERDDGGAHFEFRVAKPKPKDLPFYERVRPTIEANFAAGFDILRTMVAEHATALTVENEPALPVSRVRRNSEICQRLGKVEGIGPVTATALVAAVGDRSSFKNGRQFAAWLGLVPKQRSSGGRARLFGISKRGDRYLRALLIHGARAALGRVRDKQDLRSLWLGKMRLRRHPNVVAVALANKNARIAWSLLTSDNVYDASLSVGAA